jgi:SAM-dependent methyltransferase
MMFDDLTDRYARFRPDYPAALIDVLANYCASHRVALDVGCGSGQLSRALTDRFERVIAADVSAAQVRDAKPHPKVEYQVAPAQALPVPDRSVDLVTAAQAAHWFDLHAFYDEVRRVTRVGGVVALLSYGVPALGGNLSRLFDDWYWGDAHQFWPGARHHVETGYRDLPFGFEEHALPALSIERDWSLAEFLGYISTWSATKQATGAGRDLVAEARRALAHEWPHESAVPITWPITGRVGRV